MEITYDSGAKVILQGPCTYEIDSDRSGFLAVGRLAARVEKGSGIRGQGSGKTHSSAFSLQPSALFAVRTPTAIVTDLGTEFGVEVEKSGATRSHVFQGKVKLVASGQWSMVSDENTIYLTAGKSARVERGRNNKAAITREPSQPGRFVRSISKSPNHQISKSHYQLPITNYQLSYRLTDLGTIGGRMSRANAINDVGHVVGEAMTANGMTHAFLYANGKMKDLSAPGEGNSAANSINAAGEVAGDLQVGRAGQPVAFLYSSGKKNNLGTLGGQMSRAYAMNDSGAVVGFSRNSSGATRAFLYTRDESMKDLGALGGATANSYATSINASGLIVGYSETKDGVIRAVLYNAAGGMEELSTSGGQRSWAYGINDAGQTIGFSIGADNRFHAVLYGVDKTTTNLLDLCAVGDMGEIGFCINNAGQVVGSARMTVRGATEVRSFLYSGGRLFDLASMVDAAGWTHWITTAINDFGQIVGFGQAPDGNTRAFLLTPTKNHE